MATTISATMATTTTTARTPVWSVATGKEYEGHGRDRRIDEKENDERNSRSCYVPNGTEGMKLPELCKNAFSNKNFRPYIKLYLSC